MSTAMNNDVFLEGALNDLVEACTTSLAVCSRDLQALADWICQSLEKGGKLILCGNGGSAADSQHIAAEFVNRFRLERRPLPAIALTTDTSILTAIANDYDFDQIFSKQVEALARPEDVVLGISTSGNSPNILRALETAQKVGSRAIGLTGGSGGKMQEDGVADMVFCVSSHDTPRIQEVHIFLGHLLCDLVERQLFPSS
jgi:D-sedoheptulose 7-phosphate isomerase